MNYPVYYRQQLWTHCLPPELGRIHENRGFLFGESIFTSFRSYAGKFWGLSDHFTRLQCGLEYLALESGQWGQQEELIRKGLKAILESFRADERNLRFRVTLFSHYGEGPFHRAHDLDFLVTCSGLPPEAETSLLKVSLPAQTPGLNQGVPLKGAHYLERMRLLRKMQVAPGEEVVFLNNLGHPCETLTSNIFFVLDSALVTPPIRGEVYGGITRKFLLKLLREKGVPVNERDIEYKEILEAQEIFLTNCVTGIKKVRAIQMGTQKKVLGESQSSEIRSLFESELSQIWEEV